MNEKIWQDYQIDILKKYSIDFVRIPNQAASGKFASTKSSAVFTDPKDQSCIKNFPDVMFCFGGKVYMREYGVMGRHNERKNKQYKRMHHWKENGNADIKIIFGLDEAKEDMKSILGSKFMEIA